MGKIGERTPFSFARSNQELSRALKRGGKEGKISQEESSTSYSSSSLMSSSEDESRTYLQRQKKVINLVPLECQRLLERAHIYLAQSHELE